MQSRRETLKKLGAWSVISAAGLAGCSGDGGDGSGDGGDGGDGGGSDGGDGDDGGDGGSDGGDGESTSTSSGGETTSGGDTVTAAYVYNEAVSNLGWVNTHEVARTALEEKYDWYETQIVEEITVSEAKTTFQDLANQDVDVIEAATFGYGSPAAEVVQNNDIYIETPRLAPVEGYSGPGLGYYLGKLEEACYVAGKGAGMLTETNVLGYVNSFAIPSTLTELNALVEGAKSVNPDVEMVVRHVNSWYDPGKERSAAQDLVDQDADVLGYRTSTPVVFGVAEENDLWAYGYADGFNGTEAGFDKYITSRMWDWEPFYDQTAQWAREGRPGAEERFQLDELRGNYFGFEQGGVKMDTYGSTVPDDVASEMDATVEGLSTGDITDEDVFGDTKWADWTPFERISQVGSYTEGIRGEVPS